MPGAADICASVLPLYQIAPKLFAGESVVTPLQDFAHLGKFDVFLCRNVLIYFDQGTKINIFDRKARVMELGGMLMLVAAETVVGITEAFKPCADKRWLYRPNLDRGAARRC
jgi:chemotaxis protein methyltransferase CheR